LAEAESAGVASAGVALPATAPRPATEAAPVIRSTLRRLNIGLLLS
jgi:hypothetical protein